MTAMKYYVQWIDESSPTGLKEKEELTRDEWIYRAGHFYNNIEQLAEEEVNLRTPFAFYLTEPVQRFLSDGRAGYYDADGNEVVEK